MTKLEQLKDFAENVGVGDAEESIYEKGGYSSYSISWPSDKDLEKVDTIYVYVTSSYKYGWQGVMFNTIFTGEQWSAKHDCSTGLYGVIRYENGEWVNKEWKVVQKCEILD